MIVVADASPLIFLAKIRQLELIHKLLGKDIRLPTLIRDEVLAPNVDAAEQRVLESFLATCKIKSVLQPRHFASAMSRADDAALTLAIRESADTLLCDEKVTRMMAETEGIRPLGTLGILLRAMRQQLISSSEAKRLLDTLIQPHGFRISIEVYRAALLEIDRHR